MTDELSNALNKLPGLRVASRTSTFAFKGKRDLSLEDIGKRLNVQAVLEGTVRRSGERLRVTAQLTNVADGLALWSDMYERKTKDVFDVQDDIAGSIDPAQPVYDIRPMQDRVRDTWGTQRLLTSLFTVFAVLALVLATIGLYGVLAYTTVKRIREIGVRMALGAQPAQIRTLILSHGLHLLLIGSAIGLVAAFALSRALQSVLFDVKGLDPRIYLGVGALLFLATFLASWIPARRASRVDPIVALRTE